MKTKTGFTLVEILVVIAVIAVLVLVSIPGFRALMPNVKLRNTTKEMTSSLRQAQQNTVTEQTIYLVKFYPEQNKYSLIKREDGLADTLIEDFTVDSSLTISLTAFTDNEVIFTTTGAVNEAGDIVLSLEGGKSRTVSVRPSGFVTIVE